MPEMCDRKARLYSLALLPGVVRGADLASIVLGAFLSYVLYFGLSKGPSANTGHYILVCLAALLLWINVTQDLGLYRLALVNNLRRHVRQTLLAWGLVLLCVLALGFFLDVSALYSRGWVALWTVMSACLFGGVRLALFALFHRGHVFGRFAWRTAIYGGPEDVRRLARILHAEGRRGFVHVVGLFSTETGSESETLDGGLAELFEMARAGRLDNVILALPWRDGHVIHDLSRQLRNVAVDVRLAPEPDFFDLPWQTFAPLGGVPMIHVHERASRAWHGMFKRMEDVALSVLFLLVLAPVMLVVALLVRLDGPGPVLVRREVGGFDDRPIRILRFRSRPAGDAEGRPTRLGRILCRVGLDGLPRLFNVLAGDMSLVGPSVHPADRKVGDEYYHRVFAEYARRHHVRPGMTGLAQVSGCDGDVDGIEKARRRLEYDLWYVDHWSVGLDLVVIWRSLGQRFSMRRCR